MTPTDGRSRTTSESKDIIITTTSNGQTATNSIASGGDEDFLEVTMFDDGAEGSRLPDVVAESKIYGVTHEDEPLESYLAITIQVFIPFLIAGIGMVGAGLVLDLVQAGSPISGVKLLALYFAFVRFAFRLASVKQAS